MANAVFTGLGPADQKPTLGPKKLTELKLSAEEGFVLSRVDGRTSLDQICKLVPFEPSQTQQILRRLWEEGGITLPLAPSPTRRAAAAEPAAPSGGSVDLTKEQMQRIDALFSALETRNAFELLELDPSADPKTLKKAYFRLSKEFHPDRFFGKNLGDYKHRVTECFKAIKAAFELLSDPEKRAAYMETVTTQK